MEVHQNGGGGSGAGNNGGAGAGGEAGSTVDFISGGGGEGGQGVDCVIPCDPGQICTHGTCIDNQSCDENNDCDNDTYCNVETGLCEPWDIVDPGADDTCALVAVPGLLSPRIKCEFSQPPAGDPFPDHVDVQGTPVVVNFNNPPSAGSPSIAASFTATTTDILYTEDLGVIRVLSGDDCSLQANLGGTDLDGDSVIDYTVSSASLAVADLDGDGVAEIVAYGSDGSTLAFTLKNGTWSLLWKAPLPPIASWNACDTPYHFCPLGWSGPSIHDIDDDGSPDIIRESVVFDANGALKSVTAPEYSSYYAGLFPVIANFDADEQVEFTNGQYVWEWLGGGWVLDENFPGENESGTGFSAVADFGDFGTGLPDDAEIAVVRNDQAMIYALDGSWAMAPIEVPGPGNAAPGGGPPTISDFDGDGLVELGVAGRAYYTVFDIDCTDTPRPGGVCNLGHCDHLDADCPAGGGVLWTRESQDISSNVTGSSIFDFEADGTAEVVYGDECFVRVYSGDTGEVLFSQYRSSCTWYENPIIADTDGNFRANLVTQSNKACSPDGEGIGCQLLNGDGVDPLWNGVACKEDEDCLSDNCVEGLCRCNNSAQCCPLNDGPACIEAGLKCSPPNLGTAGIGNTCRASHPHGVSGIRVYSDQNDQWVRSRTIWSQHAYAVTHIDEQGTVPATSAWEKNWLQPELNNFRQNVPGEGSDPTAIPDATAGASQFDGCNAGEATLTVDICNRGSAPQGAGIPVGFYAGEELLCTVETTMPLAPEQCEEVECVWTDPPTTNSTAIDVTIVADDGGLVAECHEGNNLGTIQGVFCEPPQ